MAELNPRITFDGSTLELRRDFGEKTNEQLLEHINSLDGYEIIEGNPDISVLVDIKKVVRPNKKELDFFPQGAEELIKTLGSFTIFDFDDQRDGVFSLDFWFVRGATGVAYPQFQSWLNEGGITEEVSKAAIEAMAFPLGKAAEKIASKEFYYRTDGLNATAGDGGFSFGLLSRREEFGLSKSMLDEDDLPRTLEAKVDWNWLDIITLGSCACWGPAGDERSDVHISPENKRLYQMDPHNVDAPGQSLGLVLAAATLARQAANYENEKDLLGDVDWTVAR